MASVTTCACKNNSGERVEAVVTVDGRDVVSGELGNYKTQRGYVIEAYGSVVIEGFRQSLDQVAAFRFTDIGNSYSARRGSRSARRRDRRGRVQGASAPVPAASRRSRCRSPPGRTTSPTAARAGTTTSGEASAEQVGRLAAAAGARGRGHDLPVRADRAAPRPSGRLRV
jgi:hypothetical protein